MQQGGEVFEGVQGGLGGGTDIEVGGLFGEVGGLGHLGALSRGAGEAAWKRKRRVLGNFESVQREKDACAEICWSLRKSLELGLAVGAYCERDWFWW